jgi:hypothetical protein
MHLAYDTLLAQDILRTSFVSGPGDTLKFWFLLHKSVAVLAQAINDW